MKCSVVIPAAGRGSRFGGPVPKQLVPLRGRPLLARTLDRFLSFPETERVVIAVAAGSRDLYTGFQRQTPGASVILVDGGTTRQHSVLAALRALGDANDTLVAIHDAVRPFLAVRVFQSVLAAASACGAAVPVLSSRDTIHRVHDGCIIETPERASLRTAQTPQCFRLGLILPILEEACERGEIGTDEAAIVAARGHQVRVVEGDPVNLKITTPEDLHWAEAMLDRWSDS